MRGGTDIAKLTAFIDSLGRAAQSEGRVYIVGGASALLLGVREQTVDIDLKLDPEPKGVFESIADLKNRLDVNVELASPDQFLPPLPGWQDRSEFIARKGEVDFFHYDFYSQALSKILRGYRADISDARALVSLGKVELNRLVDLFREVEPGLIRYPAIDPNEFRQRLEVFVSEAKS